MATKGPNPVREFADAIRSSKGLESHDAVAQSLRVEYIRGIDFVEYAEKNTELFDRFCKGKPPAEQAREVGELLLRRGLLRRCDYLYKNPPPGKKLAKFPRKLVFFNGPDALVFSEDAFYAWTYARPMSRWVYAGTGLAMVLVLLACLFPLAPYYVKVVVLYLSAGLLMAIIAVIVVRALLAAFSWVVTGKTVWILPNILSEVPLNELLKPVVSVEASEPGTWGNNVAVRLGVGAALCGIFYVLYTHSPDKGTMAAEASKYRDEIFELLNVHREGYHKLAGETTGAPMQNTTAGNLTGAESPQESVETGADSTLDSPVSGAAGSGARRSTEPHGGLSGEGQPSSGVNADGGSEEL